VFLSPACPLLSLGPPGSARVSEEHRSWQGGPVVGGSGQWLAGRTSGWRRVACSMFHVPPLILRGVGGQKKKPKKIFREKKIIGSGSPNQLPNMEHGTPVGAHLARTLACKGEVRRHAASPGARAGCSMPSPSPLHKTTHVARTAQRRLRSRMTSGPSISV
jgi:hypothetical protein